MDGYDELINRFESIPFPGSWVEAASCKGLDVNLFFLRDYEPVPLAVKRACKDCPVAQPCIEYAARYNLFGIWGGTGRTGRGKRKTKEPAVCPSWGAVARHSRDDSSCEVCDQWKRLDTRRRQAAYAKRKRARAKESNG